MSLYFVGDLNVLADKRLSVIDKLVYFALVSYMDRKDGKCYPRYATIKKRTGISIAAIQRSIQNLAKLKFISKKRLSSTNLYLLSQQKILEDTIKKRVITLTEGRDISHRGVLIKPSYKTNYRYKNNVNNYNRIFSRQGVANPSLDETLVYKGEKYKKSGEEGFWTEYYHKGRKIRKHKFKNTIEELFESKQKTSSKKFNAAAEKAAMCG